MRRLCLSLVVFSTLAFAQPEAPAAPPLVPASPSTPPTPPAPTALELVRGRLGLGFFGTDFIPVLAGEPTGSAQVVHLTPLANSSGFSRFIAAPRLGFRRWSETSLGPIQSVGLEVTVATAVALNSGTQTKVEPFETTETVAGNTVTTTSRQQGAQSGFSGGGVGASVGVPLALLATTHVIASVTPRASLRFARGSIAPRVGSEAPTALSTTFGLGLGLAAGVEVFLTALGLPNWSVEGSLSFQGAWTSLRLESGNNLITSQTLRLETSFDSSPADGLLGGFGLKYYF